jgi:hypothetical protein
MSWMFRRRRETQPPTSAQIVAELRRIAAVGTGEMVIALVDCGGRLFAGSPPPDAQAVFGYRRIEEETADG